MHDICMVGAYGITNEPDEHPGLAIHEIEYSISLARVVYDQAPLFRSSEAPVPGISLLAIYRLVTTALHFTFLGGRELHSKGRAKRDRNWDSDWDWRRFG